MRPLGAAGSNDSQEKGKFLPFLDVISVEMIEWIKHRSAAEQDRRLEPCERLIQSADPPRFNDVYKYVRILDGTVVLNTHRDCLGNQVNTNR